MQVADDDLIALVHRTGDDDAIAITCAERHETLFGFVVGPNHIKILAGLRRADRRLRHKQRIRCRADRQAHAHELAGQQRPFGIGDLRAGGDRAARAIDDIVEKDELAFDARLLVPGEEDLRHDIALLAALLQGAARRSPPD